MSSEPRAKVIVCGQNKFIIHNDQLFAHTNQSVTSQGTIVDNWKCVHRRCFIRMWTWDQKFKAEADHHVHSSTASSYLSGQDYSVVQELNCFRCAQIDTPPSTPPIVTSSVQAAPSRGKELRERPLGSVDSAGSSSPPSPKSWSVLKYKAPGRPSVNGPLTPTASGDDKVWTPPVLSPPADGRPYEQCIPPKQVAQIGPCPEPNTYYHPYFAYQLHNYYNYLNRMRSYAAESHAYKSQHYDANHVRTARLRRVESD